MPAPTRRLLACATSIAAAVGLLAGCTDGTTAADPTDTTTTTGSQPSMSATPSPDVTAAAPQWTAAMDEVSADGALAVGQYFLELFPYVHATGDTTAWRSMSHPDCLFCADVAQDAESPPEGGFEDASVRVEVIQGVELTPSASYSLTYSMQFESESGSEDDTVAMLVVREADRWLVRGVDITVTSSDA